MKNALRNPSAIPKFKTLKFLMQKPWLHPPPLVFTKELDIDGASSLSFHTSLYAQLDQSWGARHRW